VLESNGCLQIKLRLQSENFVEVDQSFFGAIKFIERDASPCPSMRLKIGWLLALLGTPVKQQFLRGLVFTQQ
jgi:hypothetical protein